LKEYLRGLESDIIHVVAPEKLEQFTKKENLDQLKPGTIIFVVDHEFHSTCYSAKNHNDFLNHRQVSLCVASNWYGESHEKLVRIPIGLESTMFEKRHAMTDEFIKLLKGRTEKNGKIIAAGINYSTSRSPKSSYRDDRHALKTELKDSKSVVWTKRQSGIDYLNNLAKHSFSLCPEGNGMDTHRFMESYALGARPIVRRGQMTPLHEQFPGVIFVDWWHDVNNIDPSEEKTDPELLYLDYWLYKSLRSRCKIVMFFTSGLIDEWRNFLISARRVNVDDLLMIFPLDVESRDAVVKENILCRDDLLTDKLAKEASFATEAFNDIMIYKLKAIEKTLSEGWITFYLDTDIVLLGDPIKEYFKYPAKPIYMQSDEKGFRSGTNHCAGVMTLVPGKENTRCIREAIEMSSSTFDDQKAMNRVVNRKKLGTYDPYFYPNGARWFWGGRKKIEKLGITPILIHNNYIKGLKPKIDRFKEHGYWYLDASPSMLRELTNPKVKEDHDIYESVKYKGAVFSGPRDMVSRMKKGKYEKEEIGLLNKMKFTSDDVVLELGGCLGVVSVITNKRLHKLSGGIPKHKVVEANPELLSILKENKSKNKATFDIVHGLVSLDSDGSFYAYDKAVAGSAHRLDNKEKNKREYKVPVLHPSIFADTTVLIMDIEGGELQALQEILPLCPKIRLIMVEIHEFLMYKGFGEKVETLLRSNQFKRSKKSGITYVYERKNPKVERLGTNYGGWYVPAIMELDDNSIVYSAGVGEDISFDLLLHSKYNCNIYLIDPTFAAAKHYAEVMQYYLNGKSFTGNIQQDYYSCISSLNPNFDKFEYIEVGLWDQKDELKFYKQTNEKYVSQSLVENMFGQKYDTVQVDTIKSMMDQHGHTHIDLLKLDIEGAEIKTVNQMLDDQIYPTYVLIEFDLFLKKKDLENNTQKLIDRMMQKEGYKMIKNDNFNITFMRSPSDAPLMLQQLRPAVDPTNPKVKEYRTCAVVGSGPAIMEREYGAEIDSHDCIIRCNRAPSDGFEKNVGSRTDIRILNVHVYNALRDPNYQKAHMKKEFKGWDEHSCADAIGPHEKILLKDSDPNGLKPFLPTHTIERVPSWILEHESKIRGQSLTTGFCAILLASSIAEEVNCYGFNFFKGNDYNHYFETVNKSGYSHAIDDEMKYINALSNIKIIREDHDIGINQNGGIPTFDCGNIKPKKEELLLFLKQFGIVTLTNFYESDVIAEMKNELLRVFQEQKEAIQILDKEGCSNDERIFNIEKESQYIKDTFSNNILLNSIAKDYTRRPLKKKTLANKLIYEPGKRKNSGAGWHRDNHDMQFKCLLYLTDVTEKNGNFQFITNSSKRHIGYPTPRTSSYNTRFADSTVDTILSSNNDCQLYNVVGKAGTLVIADTTYIHRGNIIEEGERLALTEYFT